MLSETILSKKRGDHNVERRVLKKLHHKHWRTNYAAHKQAMDKQARKELKARA